MSGFDVKYAEYQRLFEERLENFCNKLNCQPQILKESLIYSLKLGGKRIRPVLMLSFADLLGLDKNNVLNFALALELIHTYSLIHDDLPEMDNDDFRRGEAVKITKFSEPETRFLQATGYSIPHIRYFLQNVSTEMSLFPHQSIYATVLGSTE